MSKYLFLERFNNYFNRKVIKYNDVDLYKTNSKSFVLQDEKAFSFKPNDNVSTEIIANAVGMAPDYFIELTDEGNINSRWFIIETIRLRQGQWKYILRRDVIADNLDNLLDAPIFVEKGMLPENDKFILNDEGMSFNQIKREEKFIKDESQTAWIVGYIAKNTDGKDINISIPSEVLSGDISTISDIATAMGTTEGTLSALLNFDGSINNYICFARDIDIYFGIKYRDQISGDDYLFRYNFSDVLEYKLTDFTDRESISNFLFDSTIGSSSLLNKLNSAFSNAVETYKASLLSQIPSIVGLNYYFNQEQLNILRQYNGRTIFYNSKYYILQIIDSGNTSHRKGAPFVSSLYTSLNNIATKTANDVSELSLEANPYYVDLIINGNNIAISLNEVSDSDIAAGYEFSISGSRTPTMNQEYDMFAIPLEAGLPIESANSGISFTNTEGVALKAASALAKTLGKALYDIQLLPYFPYSDNMFEGNYFNLDKLISNAGAGQVSYSLIGTTGTYAATKTITLNGPVGYHGPVSPTGYTTWYLVIGAENFGYPSGSALSNMSYGYNDPNGTVSSVSYSEITDESNIVIGYRFQYTLTNNSVPPDAAFSITITASIDVQQGAPASVVVYCKYSSFRKFTTNGIPAEINNANISLKVLSNAYYMRLCSPNYQGSFDINIGKNNGKIKGFWLYGTYKPYTPYVKVAPLFESLYGENFGDQRGLICSGDFSLPRIIDEWQNYELNNKNYQNIFNREIQNMEFMQYYERRNQIISGAAGIVGDTAKGAASGAYLGGGWGAAIGGVVGGGVSAAGFAIDLDTLAKTQKETKEFAIDKFNYQLGNIKALPYTLTNIGAFNINSKIYPFLEIYTPTEEELEAFKNKIKWESMTVMRIGTMREFMNFNNELNYFKGSLIRNDEIADDYHVVEAIYAELLKGVYM